ncbi:phage tail domain-containing protein [Planococcus dechangensis]|uniref:Phage tail domain-containing protein n=1 Tax=Planococcus dechangensis TaxID=1176255 RepID=A0ABV9M8T5_9BACL
MKVRLYDPNMNEIILRGVTWLEITPEPVTAERYTEKVYNGDVPLGKSTNSRLINARLKYESVDYLGYKLMRNELYSIFNPIKDMWAVDEEVPGIMWKVDVEDFDIERINGRIGLVNLVFYSATTYARSIGTSLDAFTYDSGLWGYGMGLQGEASTQNYIHSSANFSIFNPSNVEVDPREHELKITLRSISATGSDIRVRNTTSDEVWRYQGPFNVGDIITIDGVITKRNGTNAVGFTGPTFSLISLVEGNNAITISGISGGFEITFEFPFLYV